MDKRGLRPFLGLLALLVVSFSTPQVAGSKALPLPEKVTCPEQPDAPLKGSVENGPYMFEWLSVTQVTGPNQRCFRWAVQNESSIPLYVKWPVAQIQANILPNRGVEVVQTILSGEPMIMDGPLYYGLADWPNHQTQTRVFQPEGSESGVSGDVLRVATAFSGWLRGPDERPFRVDLLV